MGTISCGRRTVRLTAMAVMLTAGLGIAGTAVGAEQQPAPPRPGAGEPALRGPEVRERNVPGAPGAFGPEEEVRRQRQRERVPLPVFRDAVMSLRGEDAAAEVRLSEEQLGALRRHQQEFEEQRREYMREHREEMQGLRGRAGGREGGGRGGEGEMRRRGRPGEMDAAGEGGDRREAMMPERREAMSRLREIEQGAPQPEELYTKIWAELSEPQREVVEGKLNEFREARAKQREEAYVRQRAPREGRPSGPAEMEGGMEMDGPRRGPGQEAASPMEGERPRRPGAQDRGSPEQRERVERLIRIFSALPAEEQERILSRLEERARDRGAAGEMGDRREGPRRRPERRPPPSMDEVEVPRPE